MPPVVPSQQPPVELLQPTHMQPLHAQFQVQYNPNQDPQRQMAAFIVAPNQLGMQYPPQAAGFGSQQQPPAAGPIIHQPNIGITNTAAGTTSDNQLKLPRYALTMSVSMYILFIAFLCWIPGNLCLLPAVITAIVVSRWNLRHDIQILVV